MKSQNLVDDDINDLAKASLNQPQSVIPAGTKVAQTLSSAGVATGTVASPGPAGFGGADRPGRRTYNPLAKLASYTYNLSLYMLTPLAYEMYVDNGRRRIDAFSHAEVSDSPASLAEGAYLVCQSGGINNSVSKRAPGFELDYYIDNLSFECVTSQAETGTANASTIYAMTFNITEPYGFSFLTNLRKAVNGLIENAKATNMGTSAQALKQRYVLGIRFYGYDVDGRLVKANDEVYGEVIDPLGSGSDLFEVFYDIQINQIKFKLDGKSTVYNVEASGVASQTLHSTKRGRVNMGATVEGYSVDDALQDLMAKLNKAQTDLLNTNPPSLKIPNTFKIVYQGDAESRLGGSLLATESNKNKTSWGGSGANDSTESTDTTTKKPPDKNKKQIVINNDTSITQAIETIVKNSDFIEQTLKTIYSNTPQPDPKSKSKAVIENASAQPVSWFTVTANVVKMQFDNITNDWAYDTEFVIQMYELPAISTPYSTGTRYYGPHKRYDYLFTGKNSEVLDLSINFDTLYYQAVLQMPAPVEDEQADTGGQNPGEQREQQGTTAGNPSGSTSTGGNANNKGTKQDPQTTSDGGSGAQPSTATSGGYVSVTPGLNPGGDKTGKLGTSSAAENSLLNYLNDPHAFANAKMKIIGDPDFLVRDSATSINELYSKFYDTTNGFSINANGGQVFIEVAFKEAKDYDNGIMTINEEFFMVNYPPYIKEMTDGVIWKVNTVKNTFSGGVFTQDLQLVFPTFTGTGSSLGPPVTEDPTLTEVPAETNNPDQVMPQPKSSWDTQMEASERYFDKQKVTIPPPKMSTVAPTMQSSSQSILQNTDNFGRPVTINTFGQK